MEAVQYFPCNGSDLLSCQPYFDMISERTPLQLGEGRKNTKKTTEAESAPEEVRRFLAFLAAAVGRGL